MGVGTLSKTTFSVIPARAGSVVLLGHFLMARTIPPSFVEIGPKLRVVALLTRQWPKTAKNRVEPQKITPSSETEIFFGGGSNGKNVAPGIVFICSIDPDPDPDPDDHL